jgi:3-phenylpropionate/cinnamic acid dioxygenase small subunit
MTTASDHRTPPELLPFPVRGARRPDLDAAVTAFAIEESAALDERRYDDWLAVLAEDFIYQVPVPLLREDPALPRHSDSAMLFEATKHVLALKLGRVGLQYAWSDRPSGVMRHFLSGIRVFDSTEPGTVRVDCNVLGSFNRGPGEAAIATALREDVLADLGDGRFELRQRRVLLDAEVASHLQLSVIF